MVETTSIDITAPFTPLFKKVGNDFPSAFQYQFLHSVDETTYVMLEGEMDKVWHRPTWLWPLFWILSWFDILFPETGTNIPASMKIIGGRDKYNQPFQRWNRTFTFKKSRYFNATMAYDEKQQCIVEWLGPINITQIVWDIQFQPPATIRIITKGCNLIIGKVRVPLLKWFYPQVKAIETAVEENVIHIDLEVSHPLMGTIFGYEGYFQIRLVSNGK